MFLLKFLLKRPLLVIIFLLALFLRTWNLSNIPEAVDEDEMALGYYAYSLITNGTDEYGNKFPIYFESVGDYKYGLYSYFTTIPVFLLGLNPFSARIVSALSGSLSVVAIYFLALEILKKEKYALISSLILAVNPMHIHFSRVAYNNILGSFFVIISVYFFLKYIRNGINKTGIISFFFFVVSIFTYQTYRVFLPLVLMLLFMFSFKQISKTVRARVIVFVTLVVISVFLSFVPKESRARAQNFDQLYGGSEITEGITEDSYADVALLVTRIFHNKVLSLALGYTKRYLSFFDPVSLFVQSSPYSERHAIPGVGLLYLIEVPLLILGVIYLTKIIKNKKKFIPLILVLATPVAPAMVLEGKNFVRGIIIVYGLVFLVAVGIYYLSNIKKLGKFFIFLILTSYILNFLYVSHQYLVHKIYHNPWNSDVGLKEMVSAITEKYYQKYDTIVVSKGHYIPFLFYNKVKPQDFLANSKIASKNQTQGVRVERFGKIVFNMPYDCPLVGKAQVLYVCFGYRIPTNSKVLEVIRFRDQQPAIILLEFIPASEVIEGTRPPDRVEYFKDTDLNFKKGVLPDTYEKYWI